MIFSSKAFPGLRILATGRQPLGERLIEAWTHHLSHLENDLSEGELKQAFCDLSLFVEERGGVTNMIEHMNDGEVEEFASQVFGLCVSVLKSGQ